MLCWLTGIYSCIYRWIKHSFAALCVKKQEGQVFDASVMQTNFFTKYYINSQKSNGFVSFCSNFQLWVVLYVYSFDFLHHQSSYSALFFSPLSLFFHFFFIRMFRFVLMVEYDAHTCSQLYIVIDDGLCVHITLSIHFSTEKKLVMSFYTSHKNNYASSTNDWW